MIGKIFEIMGDTIIPKEECKFIAPLRAIMDGDYPQKIWMYLHCMKSMRWTDNPYADVDVRRRSDIIISDLELDIDPEDRVIRTALQCVEEIYYTTSYGLYRGLKSMGDKIGEKLLQEDITLDKDGNSANVVRLMKEYENLSKLFKQAYRDFENENTDMKVRGGGQLADDEDIEY